MVEVGMVARWVAASAEVEVEREVARWVAASAEVEVEVEVRR